MSSVNPEVEIEPRNQNSLNGRVASRPLKLDLSFLKKVNIHFTQKSLIEVKPIIEQTKVSESIITKQLDIPLK